MWLVFFFAVIYVCSSFFLKVSLYQWLYFINIMSNGYVYSVYAFDVVCDNKEFLMEKILMM